MSTYLLTLHLHLLLDCSGTAATALEPNVPVNVQIAKLLYTALCICESETVNLQHITQPDVNGFSPFLSAIDAQDVEMAKFLFQLILELEQEKGGKENNNSSNHSIEQTVACSSSTYAAVDNYERNALYLSCEFPQESSELLSMLLTTQATEET